MNKNKKNPRNLIQEAIDAMNETHKNNNYSLMGSSTVCTSIIDKDKQRNTCSTRLD